MNLGSIVGIILIIAMMPWGVMPQSAMSQQKSTKEQLVGTWAYVSSTATMPEGSPLWGTDPKGLMIFTENGRFSWQIFRSDRPKFASKNRMQGTPEENAADLRGSLAYFGTYWVDEPEKTITTIIEGSTFPNWEGSLQTRSIDKLTDEEFINTNPQVGAGRGSAYNLYRRAR